LEAVFPFNAALLVMPARLFINPTSDGYQTAKELWEQNRSKTLSLAEIWKLVSMSPACPFQLYGNTFVTISKTLLTRRIDAVGLPTVRKFRSIAGHIVGRTATILAKTIGGYVAALENRLVGRSLVPAPEGKSRGNRHERFFRAFVRRFEKRRLNMHDIY